MRLIIKDDDSVAVELDQPDGGYDDGYRAGYADGSIDEKNAILNNTTLKKVVGFDKDGYYLVTQDSKSITNNGTYNTAYNDEVTVNVEKGYDGYQSISGTLNNILGSSGITFERLIGKIRAVQLSIIAMPRIEYDATAISAGTGFGSIYAYNTQLYAVGANVESNTSSAFMMTWDRNGLVSAYIEQNGTVTDISPYAQAITTTIYLPTKEETT